MTKSVRWGFLGAGFVATKGMAPAVHASRGASLHVVGSQDVDRGRELGATRVVQGYQAVLDTDDVDAVYVSLSNEQHMPWVLKALAAGKHVLCEKPLSVSAADTRALLEAAKEHDRLLIEGLWSRWHPRFAEVRDGLLAGRWGSAKEFDAGFTFGGVPADNYRLDPHRGGGAWWDVGVYPLDLLLSLHPGADVAIEAVARRTGPTGVDLDTVADLRVAATKAHLTTSIDSVEEQWLSITTDVGVLAVKTGQPFTSWRAPTDVVFTPRSGAVETLTYPAVDPYVAMIEDVSAVIGGSASSSVMPTAVEMQRLADVMDAVATRR